MVVSVLPLLLQMYYEQMQQLKNFGQEFFCKSREMTPRSLRKADFGPSSWFARNSKCVVWVENNCLIGLKVPEMNSTAGFTIKYTVWMGLRVNFSFFSQNYTYAVPVREIHRGQMYTKKIEKTLKFALKPIQTTYLMVNRP